MGVVFIGFFVKDRVSGLVFFYRIFVLFLVMSSCCLVIGGRGRMRGVVEFWNSGKYFVYFLYLGIGFGDFVLFL